MLTYVLPPSEAEAAVAMHNHTLGAGTNGHDGLTFVNARVVRKHPEATTNQLPVDG